MALKTLKTCLAALLIGGLPICLIANPNANEPEQGKEPDTKQVTGASGKQSSDDAASSPPAKPAPSSTSRRTSPDFSPTEEISEDIAIPFPVDI
ncbi:MAG: hypothetical protein CMK46_09750 [Porticoccus sp.]|jgi:hypothetical protein|uniref:hypothetical protein n=1 Tax=Porticoccus TaxID=1123967 RepID=UPI00055E17A6|nr:MULTISPECIES: hypothetical protein [Porticoccus]MAZ70381.1 hypothetical protein [Porticoccus sp.]MBG58550.1 hypothetical protein [Porticoccus sp.]|tara:strand:+ start:442 stop:723 length:282 start_codon:yes stop_codon:yes gene_type:complete